MTVANNKLKPKDVCGRRKFSLPDYSQVIVASKFTFVGEAASLKLYINDGCRKAGLYVVRPLWRRARRLVLADTAAAAAPAIRPRGADETVAETARA